MIVIKEGDPAPIKSLEERVQGVANVPVRPHHSRQCWIVRVLRIEHSYYITTQLERKQRNVPLN